MEVNTFDSVARDKFIPALTGLRAIAAYMVFAHHFNPFPSGNVLHSIVNEMHAGVSVFFVLSGFLICYRYESTAASMSTWMQTYFQNRVARIYPLYFILTILTFAVAEGDWNWRDFILNITLLKGFSDALKFRGIAQGWTLTIEEVFYLTAPLLFLLTTRRLWIWPLAALVVGGLLVMINFNTQPSAFFGDTQFMLIYTFFGRSTEFAVGVYLARRYRRDNAPWHGVKTTTLAGVSVIVILLAMSQSYHPSQVSLESTVSIILNNFVLPFAIGAFLLGLLKERSMIQWLLECSPLQLLGKSSYAFYLIHIGVIQAALSLWVTQNTIVLFILLNVGAIGLYLFIEEPLRKVIRSNDPVGQT